jgi:hypothetical protein
VRRARSHLAPTKRPLNPPLCNTAKMLVRISQNAHSLTTAHSLQPSCNTTSPRSSPPTYVGGRREGASYDVTLRSYNPRRALSLSVYLRVWGRGQVDLNPSICSRRSSDIGCHIESRITSTPSLRASLAAGTKSLSPANLVAVVQAVTLRERSEVPTGGGAT